jgi:hypothetical protein
MVEMREARDLQIARRVQLAGEVRERDRIGSARQRDDDARVRIRQGVLTNGAPDEIEQLHLASNRPER